MTPDLERPASSRTEGGGGRERLFRLNSRGVLPFTKCVTFVATANAQHSPFFLDEEKEAQRGKVIFQKPHSKWLSQDLHLGFPPHMCFSTSPCGWRALGAQVTAVPFST